jgi:hypothetical protein
MQPANLRLLASARLDWIPRLQGHCTIAKVAPLSSSSPRGTNLRIIKAMTLTFWAPRLDSHIRRLSQLLLHSVVGARYSYIRPHGRAQPTSS